MKSLRPAGIPDAAHALNAAADAADAPGATAYAAYVAAAALAVAEISLRLAVGQHGEFCHLLLFSADFKSIW